MGIKPICQKLSSEHGTDKKKKKGARHSQPHLFPAIWIRVCRIKKTWRRTRNADEDSSAQTQETHRTVYLWLLPSGRWPQSLHSWFKVIIFHLILECFPHSPVLYILPDSCFFTRLSTISSVAVAAQSSPELKHLWHSRDGRKAAARHNEEAPFLIFTWLNLRPH